MKTTTEFTMEQTFYMQPREAVELNAKSDALTKQAYLRTDEAPCSAYSQNTTTFD